MEEVKYAKVQVNKTR